MRKGVPTDLISFFTREHVEPRLDTEAPLPTGIEGYLQSTSSNGRVDSPGSADSPHAGATVPGFSYTEPDGTLRVCLKLGKRSEPAAQPSAPSEPIPSAAASRPTTLGRTYSESIDLEIDEARKMNAEQARVPAMPGRA